MAQQHPVFDNLPNDELTGWEQELRQALLNVLGKHRLSGFPIIEWIDRRIGGEVESRLGENDVLELFSRNEDGDAFDVSNENPIEAFLEGLSPDSFAKPEEDLRDAIFEFLASWQSKDLATLTDLERHPLVKRSAEAFLPAVPGGFKLKYWIEHRIGGEIELRAGRRGEEIKLTQPGTEALQQKSAQLMAARAMMPPPMMPPHFPAPMPGVPPMHHYPPPPMMHHGGSSHPPPGAGANKLPPAPTHQVNKDQWFDSLPSDKLLPAELALRQAIIKLIQTWGNGRKGSKPPTMNDAAADPEVRRCKSELLPSKGVRFVDWVERRIGGEIELRQTVSNRNTGQYELHLRSDDGARVSTEAIRDAFFDGLPADELTIQEQKLREALLEFLEKWPGDQPPTCTDLGKDTNITSCRKALLPPKVTHKCWIDRRIGGEIETRIVDGNGFWILGMRGTLDHAGPLPGPGSSGHGSRPPRSKRVRTR